MTTPVVIEDISALDFQLVCTWGTIVQPWIDECDLKPVWGVDCPGCDESWAFSCQPHHDVTFRCATNWECLECKGLWESRELKWYKL